VYGKGLSKERDIPKLRLEANIRIRNRNSSQEPTSTYLLLTRTAIFKISLLFEKAYFRIAENDLKSNRSLKQIRRTTVIRKILRQMTKNVSGNIKILRI
jgi:hypothetical protein